MLGQEIRRAHVKWHESATPLRLRRRDARLVVHLDDRLNDVEDARIVVDITPAKPKELAAAKARGRGHVKRDAVRILLRRVQELGKLRR